jgi:glycosidase
MANHKLVIYQLFTRWFGNTKSTNKFYGTRDENGVGKFNDITDKALQELAKFGITHVWYTGVLEHATLTDYSEFGIQPDHPLIVKGIAGSPYAVKDYYDVDPDLAVDVPNRMKEFEELIVRTHQIGLKAIIDFIPNHVARQYHSDARPAGIRDFGEDDDTSVAFSPTNNFYYLPEQEFIVPEGKHPPIPYDETYFEYPAKATGNDVFQSKPSVFDWYETIKLNYGVDYQNFHQKHFDPIPSTWLKMRDILLFWTAKGVDGFRCDMAEMVPVEFWSWVISEIQQVNPNVIFIAEIYNPAEYHRYIQQGGFTYLYDKVGLYDALRRLMEGYGSVEDITRVWQQESGDIARHMLRFLENHDEQRIASRFFANDPFVAIPAMTLSATLHSGPLMIYSGQEVGVNPKFPEGFQGDDGRTTIFDYWGVEEFQRWTNQGNFDGALLAENQKTLRDFYQRLNHFVRSSEAVQQGGFYDLQYVNIDGQSPNYHRTRTYSYLRHNENQKLLFVYNFDKVHCVETFVKIPYEVISSVLQFNPERPVGARAIFPGPGEQFFAEHLFKEGLPVTLEAVSMIVFELSQGG